MKSKAVVFLVAVLLLGSASAYGQLETSDPEALAPSNGRKIAVVPNGAPDAGTICAVWVYNESGYGSNRGHIKYAESSNGGITWTSPQQIDQADADKCWGPAIAIAPDGTRCVVWTEDNSFVYSWLFFNYKTSNGSWLSSPKRISPEDDLYDEKPSIAVDSQGKIHISSTHWILDVSNYESEYVCYCGGFTIDDINDPDFPDDFLHCLVGGMQDIITGGQYNFGTPAIATDGSDRPLVIWQGSSTVPYFSFPAGIYYHFYNGTTWVGGVSDPVELSAGLPALSGSAGNLFYGVWQSGSAVHFSTYNGSTNSWSPIEFVNNGNYPVVTALNDNIFAAWENGGDIYWSRRIAQNNWTPPVNLSNTPSTKSVFPHIALSPNDDYLYAIWLEGNAAPYEIEFREIHKGEDVFIRDCPEDNGSVPSWDANDNEVWEGVPPDYAYWVSPDITVDVNLDGLPGGPGEENPVRGKVNNLYAYVRNIGPLTAYNTVVNFYRADFGVGYPSWPSGFTYIGNFTIPILDPGETEDYTWGLFVPWDVPSGIPEHTCIWVRLDCATDPIVRDDPGWDNNIGWKNFSIETLKATPVGQYRGVVAFKTRNPDTLSMRDVYLDLFFQDWPSGWTAELSSSDCGFGKLGDTKYVFYNVEAEGDRDVTLTVVAAEHTENDTGVVHLAGTIDDSPIGGISVKVVPPQFAIPSLTEWGRITLVVLLIISVSWILWRKKKSDFKRI